jgi:hypothetical protein
MRYALLLTLLVVTSCASIVEGTSQTLTINTSPEGANCKFMREGRVIGEIPSTPGSVVVEKTKHDINVECTKKGYQKVSFINQSGSEGATWGNIIAGGGIGWAIDSASGADNKYQEVMNITLAK